MTIDLSEVKPNFEDIVQKLQTELQTKTTWKDTITAATGQTLIEFMAAVTSYNQLGILRAAQESVLDTAILADSILSIARMFGVHIQRKIPAQVTVTLNNSDPLNIYTIPIYSQFKINNVFFFNREPIIFNVGIASINQITLYQGEVYVQQYTSDGSIFQTFEFGPEDFTLSDNDLICYVNINEYKKITDGLWNYGPGERIFYENTLPSGNVEIIFGNNIFGRIPSINQIIEFTYVRTIGDKGNSATSGYSVLIDDFSNITGVTDTAITGGETHKDHIFYKHLAPNLFAANKRAVTKNDYKAIGLTYPSVIDIDFRGQAELDPTNKEFMNLIKVTVLTETLWNDTEWNTFIEWISSQSVYQVVFYRLDPEEIEIDITAEIYCYNNADLTSISSKIRTNLQALLTKRLNCLGYSIYLSDLHKTIKNSDDNINYVRILTPYSDYELNPNQYIIVDTITLTMNYGTRKDSGV